MPLLPSVLSRPGSRSPRSDISSTDPAHPARRGLFLAVILAAQLMVVLDTTIVNVALPHIQSGLGFTSGQLSWVLNAYLLTFGGLLLLGARAGDLAGRRRVFLGGLTLFTLSSLMGGLAPAPWVLLSARALQGVGAALAAPSALALLTTVFPEGAARVRAIALYTTVSAAGGATGLVAGGILTELASWRWVMFVNVPIGLAVVVLGRSVVTETPRRTGRFDVVGALASTLGVSALVFGLVETGTRGWTAPVTVVAFVIGLALLAVFVVAERRADEPVLPLRLLTAVTRSTANGARALIYAGMYGLFYFLSLYFQEVQHLTPIAAGLAFVPMPVSVFLASQATSRAVLPRFGAKPAMIGGAALATAGLLTALPIEPGTPYGRLVLSLILVGLGSGMAFVSLTSASLDGVDPADAGAASGLVNVSQQLGAALGLAVLVSVFEATTPSGGAGTLAAGDVVHGLRTVFGLGALFTLAGLVAIVVGIRRPAPASDPVVVPISAATAGGDEWPELALGADDELGGLRVYTDPVTECPSA